MIVLAKKTLKGGSDAFFKRVFLRGDTHMTPTLRGGGIKQKLDVIGGRGRGVGG